MVKTNKQKYIYIFLVDLNQFQIFKGLKKQNKTRREGNRREREEKELDIGIQDSHSSIFL